MGWGSSKKKKKASKTADVASASPSPVREDEAEVTESPSATQHDAGGDEVVAAVEEENDTPYHNTESAGGGDGNAPAQAAPPPVVDKEAERKRQEDMAKRQEMEKWKQKRVSSAEATAMSALRCARSQPACCPCVITCRPNECMYTYACMHGTGDDCWALPRVNGACNVMHAMPCMHTMIQIAVEPLPHLVLMIVSICTVGPWLSQCEPHMHASFQPCMHAYARTHQL
jgi:hypothetical protein